MYITIVESTLQLLLNLRDNYYIYYYNHKYMM